MKGAEFLINRQETFPGVAAPFALPAAGPYVLKRARVLGRSLPEPVGPLDIDGFALVDILVDEDVIAKIAPHGAVDFGETPEVAMTGRIVLPLFVDVHTHLDKGHIWRRKRNPVGDFSSAIAATVEDRSANWSAADVAARMEFSLRCAYAHGTTAIRTHIDSVGPQTRISWPVLAEARERWRGRIDLQASPLFTIDQLANATHMADIEAMLDAEIRIRLDEDEVRAALNRPDEQFKRGPHTLSARGTATDDSPAFVVQDGNYLSARWPGDAYLFGRRFCDLLRPAA